MDGLHLKGGNEKCNLSGTQQKAAELGKKDLNVDVRVFLCVSGWRYR